MAQRYCNGYPQIDPPRFRIQSPGAPALTIIARDASQAAQLWARRFGREAGESVRETIISEYAS